ncbi:hypothetical protein D3C81_1042840 [compost metagenome]
MTMDPVVGKPAQRKRGRVAAAMQDGARAGKVVDGRTIVLRNQSLLETCAICRREARVIGIDLCGDGYARQRSRVLTACQRRINGIRLRQDQLRAMCDHCVDQRVNGVQTLERRRCCLAGRHLAAPDARGQFSCRQSP